MIKQTKKVIIVTIIKTIYILYSIACIGTEIWYLVTLRKIGDYKDHDVEPKMGFMIYSDVFYFISNIVQIIAILTILPNDVNVSECLLACLIFTLGPSVIGSLMYGMRYSVPRTSLGEIPFNCNVNYELPENVKIACKARFISCTLGYSIYAMIGVYALVGLLMFLLGLSSGVIERFVKNLQSHLFVL